MKRGFAYSAGFSAACFFSRRRPHSPFSCGAPRIFQPNPTAENRHCPRSFWGGHHQNDRLRCRRFPCLVALRYKLKLISYALRLYSCYPPYWRVPIRLVLGRGWKGWGCRGLLMAEAVELVMGMRRVPHRVAPHNALRADPHRVRLFCSAFSGSGCFQRRKPRVQKTAYADSYISVSRSPHRTYRVNLQGRKPCQHQPPTPTTPTTP